MLVKFHVHQSHKMAPCDYELTLFLLWLHIEVTELSMRLGKMQSTGEMKVMCTKLKMEPEGGESSRTICGEELRRGRELKKTEKRGGKMRQNI